MKYKGMKLVIFAIWKINFAQYAAKAARMNLI